MGHIKDTWRMCTLLRFGSMVSVGGLWMRFDTCQHGMTSHDSSSIVSCHLVASAFHPIPSHPIPSHPIASHRIPSLLTDPPLLQTSLSLHQQIPLPLVLHVRHDVLPSAAVVQLVWWRRHHQLKQHEDEIVGDNSSQRTTAARISHHVWLTHMIILHFSPCIASSILPFFFSSFRCFAR